MKPYVTPGTLDAKTRRWLERIAPVNTHRMPLDRGSAALLVVDMQRFFLDPGSPGFIPEGLAVLPNIRRLVDAFRTARRPVLFTRHVHHPGLLDAGIMEQWWEGMIREGFPESEIHPDLAPRQNEKVVFKHRYSAFYNTDLETVLRCLRVRDLVVTGVMTNMCCESTARDAYFRDHRVHLPADGSAATSEEMHLASLLNLAYGFAYVTTCRAVARELAVKKRTAPGRGSKEPASGGRRAAVRGSRT